MEKWRSFESRGEVRMKGGVLELVRCFCQKIGVIELIYGPLTHKCLYASVKIIIGEKKEFMEKKEY